MGFPTFDVSGMYELSQSKQGVEGTTYILKEMAKLQILYNWHPYNDNTSDITPHHYALKLLSFLLPEIARPINSR